jgi:hypothetical protein
MHRSMSPVQPDLRQIIETLQAKKIPFVLTGAHGMSTWTGRPRATHDVDVLVKGGRNHARAVKALQALYPQLERHDAIGTVEFFVPGEDQSVIDVIYPYRPDIEVTLQTGSWITNEGLRYRIPKLEPMLANKYGAITDPMRDAGTRGLDLVDFSFMVRHAQDETREPLDLERLRALGELVWPGGGGEEILRLVEQVKAGQVPRLDPPPGRSQ